MRPIQSAIIHGEHTTTRAFDDVRLVVVHHVGWEEITEWRRRGFEPTPKGVREFYRTDPEARAATGGIMPYHALTSWVGEIWQTCQINMEAPHAARFNLEGVGVAAMGAYDLIRPSQQQWNATVDFVAMLARINPDVRIRGHDEVRNKPKGCPGLQFDMDKFRHDVRRINMSLAGQEAVTLGLRF